MFKIFGWYWEDYGGNGVILGEERPEVIDSEDLLPLYTKIEDDNDETTTMG